MEKLNLIMGRYPTSIQMKLKNSFTEWYQSQMEIFIKDLVDR